jgi:hypothetical protein
VIHYNFGKAIQDKTFECTGSLDAPPLVLLSALQKLSALHERHGHQIASTIDDMVQKNVRLQENYQRPDPQTDVLYQSSFTHPSSSQSCMELCIRQTNQKVWRPDRNPNKDNPVVHYGLIASADQLMKHAYIRDYLAETEGVLCFEMEAAGLLHRFPCVVIRGICDYADTHKNDLWQGYAAATAAAYTKELLKVIPGTKVSQEAAAAAAAFTMEQSPTTNLVSPGPTDIEAVLNELAQKKGVTLHWQTSIIDLLKLFDLNSSRNARRLLAEKLNVHAGTDSSAKQNLALHKAIMEELAKNGGKVPTKIYSWLESG